MTRTSFRPNNLFMSNWGLESALREWRKSRRYTQEEIAAMLGMTRGGYANYEAGTAPIPSEKLRRLRQIGFQSSVSEPIIPYEQIRAPIPYVGLMSASSKVNWTDPHETETYEYVPSEMAEQRGRFACRIEGDSMFDLLWPDDLCVFQQDASLKIGAVVLHRDGDGRATIKQLKHNGASFILHPLNPSYEDCIATGAVVGYLVGIVREQGTRRVTVYDSHGIRPSTFTRNCALLHN